MGKKVVDELLLAHIEWKHIHVLAKRGTPLEDLPEASLPPEERHHPGDAACHADRRRRRPALRPGGARAAPHLVVAGGGILLATYLAGVGIGAYLGAMVGLNV